MAELVTYAKIQDFLDLEKGQLSDYPALAVIKLSVEAAFDNYLGRYLESAARTETHYITGPTKLLSLPALPVTTVSSLVVTMLNEDETYEQANDDFIIVKAGLEIIAQLKNAKVVITYTGGLTVVPDDIARAALIQTVYEYMGKDQVGASTVSNEGGSVTRPAISLLAVVKQTLNKYMHPLKLTG